MGKSKSPAASAAGAKPAPALPAAGSSGPTVTQKVVKREGAYAPPSQHHPFVEAMIDPRSASGMRLPDNFKSGSTAMKLVEEYVITTSGFGHAFFGVHPGLAQSWITNAVTTTTTGATETITAHPDYTAYNLAHSLARPLMYMVEITYIGAEQTSAGRLCCVNTAGTGQYLSTDISTMFDDAGCVMAAHEGMSCIVRPYQDPRFEPTSEVKLGALHLPVMYFALMGAPTSTTVFDVRITKFLEGVPLRTSLMRGMTAIEPAVPNALAIAANVGTDQADTVANTTEGKRGQVSRARKMADLAWKLLLAAGPSFGIPTGLLGSAASLAGQLSSLRLGM
jgi:hypothetical protein